jgi:hypothetical protein
MPPLKNKIIFSHHFTIFFWLKSLCSASVCLSIRDSIYARIDPAGATTHALLTREPGIPATATTATRGCASSASGYPGLTYLQRAVVATRIEE